MRGPGLRLFLVLPFMALACVAGENEPAGGTAANEEVQKLIQALAKVQMFMGDLHEGGSYRASPDDELVEKFKAMGEIAVPHLVAAAKSESRDLQLHSVLVLAEMGHKGLDALLGILEDKRSTARKLILGMVGNSVRDERFMKAAVEMVRSNDVELAVQAAQALGEACYRPGIPWLLEALRSGDRSTASAAAYSLARMQMEEGVELLAEQARREDAIPFVKAKLADALGWSGSPKAVDPLLEIFVQGMKTAEVKTEDHGLGTPVKEYHELMTGKAPKGGGLLMMLRSSLALSNIGECRPMPQIHAGLEHPNPIARRHTLQALLAGDPTAAKPLLAYLSRAAGHEIPMSLLALGKTKDPAVIAPLRKYLQGPQHIYAVLALSSAGDEAVRPHIKMLSASKEEEQRLVAIRSWTNLAKSADVQELVRLLEDDDRKLVEEALRGLGDTCNPEAEAPLMRWVKEGKNAPKLQHDGIIVLGLVGTGHSKEFLKDKRDHMEPDIRQAAAWALYLISGEAQTYKDAEGKDTALKLDTYVKKQRTRKQITQK